MAELYLSDGSEFSKIPLLTETVTTDTNLDNHTKTGYYENKQATADLKYSAAMNTASINENTTAQTQKILDALAQDKIEALQAQVSELKTQNMFCGVPRISPYGYGVVPNFATPCGCNGVTF